MNYTAQDVVDRAQVAYPGVSDAEMLKHYKEILWEILVLADVEKNSATEDLTDGTREYELSYDPIFSSIDMVYYRSSSTSATKLTPVSVEWMDKFAQRDWRTTTETGTPDKFYVDAPTSSSLTIEGKIVIGLDPIPDTDTSSGFPILTIYGTEFEEPSLTSDVPAMFQSIRVLIEGCKKLYAADRDPDRVLIWQSLYSNELHKTLSFINQQVSELDAPRLVGRWMQNIRVE